MNPTQLRLAATALQREAALLIANGNDEARLFYRGIQPLVERAIRGEVVTAVSWRDIPGSRFFSEGGLGMFPQLEGAYAEFKIAAAGAEDSAILAALKSKIGR